MLFLEASLLPLVFLSSSFSTQPVYPSKYRGVTSTLCCFITVSYGLIFASGLSSKMSMLYCVMVIPAVMGIIPIEDKVKAMFSYTRIWGLSHVFMALMNGDVKKAKLYIKFEKSLMKLQKHFTTLNTITIQRKAWKTMATILLLSFYWGPLSVSWLNTIITGTYLMLIKFPGVPGRDSTIVGMIRSCKISFLGGVEEYWVPILIRLASVLLSTLLTIAALPDREAWKLCMWV
ncbi:hypothetical protein C0J52_12105 [Blattella germanica]|nr:hypothetical protein C0J52_12105 [Blattella germanica]